jgi:hypothetical protein
MWTPTDLEAVVTDLVSHPQLDALAALVAERALAAAEKRDPSFAKPSETAQVAPDHKAQEKPQPSVTKALPAQDRAQQKPEPSVTEAPSSETEAQEKPEPKPGELGQEQAQTPYGNVLTVLDRGAQTEREAQLLAALLALSVARSRTADPETVAPKLVWLATHTAVNALLALDAALGDEADAWWTAVANIAARPSTAAADFGWGEALSAAAALRSSPSAAARREVLRLVESAENPALQTLLKDRREVPNATLNGELTAPPRGPVLTTILAFTLVLFVLQLGRVVGRFALAYRRPAELYLTPRGIELKHRTELLGKVLRDRVTLVPLGNVARVTREIRFARIGLYAGLTALVIGTYLGMSLLVDAVRVPDGSPPLLGLGVLFILVGLLLDFALSTLADSARGKCRLVVVPRKGKPFCIGAIDAQNADALLESFNAAL